MVYPHQYTVCPQDGSPLRVTTELAEGAVLRGKYQVLAKLGEGGMGIVYKVRHVHLDEIWALKLVAARLTEESGFLQRFRAEAQLMRRLDHPNVVRVHDFDDTEDGRPFIVMEYVEGQNLDAIVSHGGPMETCRALRIAIQACDALGAAHHLGIIHRDIKPANLLVSRAPDGGDLVKIFDFGIAKVKEHSEQVGASLTGTGFVVGTPDYMSPEQAEGLRGDKLDGRTDLYSLGVVLFRTLTGRLPFTADTPVKLLLSHIQSVAPDPRTLCAGLSPVTAGTVLKALEKDPADRFPDAAAMRAALEAALQAEEAPSDSTVRLAFPTASAASPPSAPVAADRHEVGPAAPSPVIVLTPPPLPTPPVQPSMQAVAQPPRTRPGWLPAAGGALAALILVGGAVGVWSFTHRNVPALAPPAREPSSAASAADRQAEAVSPTKPADSPTSAPGDSGAGGTIEASSTDRAPAALVPTAPVKEVGSAAVRPGSSSPAKNEVATYLSTGARYEKGDGVPQDIVTAVSWYRKAADRGDATAQCLVGRAYETGRGAPRDEAEAARWYEKAAEQGNARGENAYGSLLRSGTGIPQNHVEAVRWFRAAADQGYAPAQNNLGVMYRRGLGVVADDGQAAGWFRKAANQNLAVAEANLAWLFETGHGVARDEREAATWYRKAAEQGNVVAALNLGLMCRQGRGVTQDDGEAARWLRKAAEQGNPRAQFNLGVLYQAGKGTAQNDGEAAAWYRKSAEAGDAPAQNSLGVLYTLGRGVPLSWADAVGWFTKAAEQGYAPAMFNLGLAYGTGRGLARDTVEAYMWYTLAAGAGNERAVTTRDNLAKRMQRREVAEAERRAAAWQVQHPRGGPDRAAR
jgi:TPR repeat protein/tRNA A-37 threonylcarbamoyl transferase component Bud32